jgi:hypothetical protein
MVTGLEQRVYERLCLWVAAAVNASSVRHSLVAIQHFDVQASAGDGANANSETVAPIAFITFLVARKATASDAARTVMSSQRAGTAAPTVGAALCCSSNRNLSDFGDYTINLDGDHT